MSDFRTPADDAFDEVPYVILVEEPEEPRSRSERPEGGSTADAEVFPRLNDPAPIRRLPPSSEPSPESRLHEAEAAIDRELEDELSYEAQERARRVSALRVCQAVALVGAVALLVLLVIGWPYYALSHGQRPFHRFHEHLRPTGILGLPLGILGTVLIGASLAYPVRKRIARRGRAWTTVRSWMRLHVLMGLLGPALIAFHSGFAVTSALGFVSFAALVVVVLSGLTGRYLLVNLRAVESGDIDRESLRQRLDVYQRKLIELGLSPELLAEPEPAGLKEGLKRVLVGDGESRAELRRLKQAVRTQGDLGHEARLILVLARRLCRERQLLVRTSEIRHLVGAWRFLHRWLTVVLVCGASFHIAVAVRFGELWIFGGGR